MMQQRSDGVCENGVLLTGGASRPPAQFCWCFKKLCTMNNLHVVGWLWKHHLRPVQPCEGYALTRALCKTLRAPKLLLLVWVKN